MAMVSGPLTELFFYRTISDVVMLNMIGKKELAGTTNGQKYETQI